MRKAPMVAKCEPPQQEASGVLVESMRKALHSVADPEKARILQRFFKTGPGEYGEGDRFVGVVVPKIRIMAKRYRAANRGVVSALLASPFHEERLLALLILVLQFQEGDEPARDTIYRFYLAQSRHINNWDLVDLTAEHIVGAYLLGKDQAPLLTLSGSPCLWERRIAIVATFHFIKKGLPGPTLRIAERLLGDGHDLIHKAVGWMLREVGKRCGDDVEETFLRKHYRRMPRTMLRYAIERFPEDKRKAYLKGLVEAHGDEAEAGA
jgi:3-methyladenine DNA glycosylase AlkD